MSLYSLRLSVFLFFLLSANISVFTKQVREARRIFHRGWERLRYVSQMDDEQLSSWPWIISVLALVNDTVVSQYSLFEYNR